MSARPAAALGDAVARSPAHTEEIAFRLSLVGALAFVAVSRALHLALLRRAGFALNQP